jgi:hypothetical protein
VTDNPEQRDVVRAARLDSLSVLLTRIANGRTLTPEEARLLVEHVGAEVSESTTARAAAADLTQRLDIGDAQAWCKTCRRAWNSATHQCETDAEKQAYRLADILRTILSAEDAPAHCHTHPATWDGGGPCVYCTALAAARTALDEEQP